MLYRGGEVVVNEPRTFFSILRIQYVLFRGVSYEQCLSAIKLNIMSGIR